MTKSIDEITPYEWDEMYRELAGINVKDVYKMFPEAFRDMQKVVDLGGSKYGYGSFLDSDNPSLQNKANHASMSRHLAEGFMGVTKDSESGVHPYLHLALRALMAYTRHTRGIKDENK